MGISLPVVTPRLRLRNFTRSDAEAVHAYTSDPEVVKYLDWGPDTESDTCEFISLALDRNWEMPRLMFDLAIVLSQQENPIGNGGLYVTSPRHHEGEIGYCLNRQFWGNGYATEACLGLLRLGFEQLELHRIFALCDTENIASQRVLQKIGMQREGQLRKHKCQWGVWKDSYLYAILTDDWQLGSNK